MTAYRFTKEEFVLFAALCGGCPLSRRQFGREIEDPDENMDALFQSLEEKRFLTRRDGKVLVDPVLFFVIGQMRESLSMEQEANGCLVIYLALKISIALRVDLHNSGVVSLSVYRNRKELEEELLMDTFVVLEPMDWEQPDRREGQ